VLARDFPTIQGVILLFSVVYVMINLLVDLLRVLRPEDPLLERRTEEVVDSAPRLRLSVECGQAQASLWQRCMRNLVIIGGVIAADHAGDRLAAPWLGTVDPSLHRPRQP
jgi:hypothetical protein